MMGAELDNERITQLIQHRRDLDQVRVAQFELMDKALVAIPGALLGFSIVFSKDLIGQASIEYVPLLFLSWIALGGAPISVLASHWVSAISHMSVIESIDQVLKDGTEPSAFPQPRFRTIARYSSIFSLIVFSIGVILLGVFMGLNIS